MLTVSLEYGQAGEFTWTVPASLSAVHHVGPTSDVAVGPTLTDLLAQPLDFPPLATAVVPGDRVVLAVEWGVPGVEAIIAAVWAVLRDAEIRPEDVLILQPATWEAGPKVDPRSALPAAVRELVRWKTHDPTAHEACGYLAASASGERIYLSRDVLEADFILPISTARFDPVLGYRGPCAVFYPGLSTPEAFAKAHGHGHSELRPEDDRPLRQLVEEIGWLLGILFAIQVVPSSHRGGSAELMVGNLEAVAQGSRKLLDRHWRLKLPDRVQTVVAAVSAAAGPVTWESVGQAVETATHLVARGGKIVLLTDLAATPGPGIDLLRGQRSPKS
ncbi:MAG TPA: lactate racemase domain-containing protein, partial [Planctomycetaceae bacterium]|nr:lactate racemase domain-containing protein [Planctomycetaceae bacterium]